MPEECDERDTALPTQCKSTSPSVNSSLSTSLWTHQSFLSPHAIPTHPKYRKGEDTSLPPGDTPLVPQDLPPNFNAHAQQSQQCKPDGFREDPIFAMDNDCHPITDQPCDESTSPLSNPQYADRHVESGRPSQMIHSETTERATTPNIVSVQALTPRIKSIFQKDAIMVKRLTAAHPRVSPLVYDSHSPKPSSFVSAVKKIRGKRDETSTVEDGSQSTIASTSKICCKVASSQCSTNASSIDTTPYSPSTTPTPSVSSPSTSSSFLSNATSSGSPSSPSASSRRCMISGSVISDAAYSLGLRIRGGLNGASRRHTSTSPLSKSPQSVSHPTAIMSPSFACQESPLPSISSLEKEISPTSSSPTPSSVTFLPKVSRNNGPSTLKTIVRSTQLFPSTDMSFILSGGCDHVSHGTTTRSPGVEGVSFGASSVEINNHNLNHGEDGNVQEEKAVETDSREKSVIALNFIENREKFCNSSLILQQDYGVRSSDKDIVASDRKVPDIFDPRADMDVDTALTLSDAECVVDCDRVRGPHHEIDEKPICPTNKTGILSNEVVAAQPYKDTTCEQGQRISVDGSGDERSGQSKCGEKSLNKDDEYCSNGCVGGEFECVWDQIGQEESDTVVGEPPADEDEGTDEGTLMGQKLPYRVDGEAGRTTDHINEGFGFREASDNNYIAIKLNANDGTIRVEAPTTFWMRQETEVALGDTNTTEAKIVNSHGVQLEDEASERGVQVVKSSESSDSDGQLLVDGDNCDQRRLTSESEGTVTTIDLADQVFPLPSRLEGLNLTPTRRSNLRDVAETGRFTSCDPPPIYLDPLQQLESSATAGVEGAMQQQGASIQSMSAALSLHNPTDSISSNDSENFLPGRHNESESSRSAEDLPDRIAIPLPSVSTSQQCNSPDFKFDPGCAKQDGDTQTRNPWEKAVGGELCPATSAETRTVSGATELSILNADDSNSVEKKAIEAQIAGEVVQNEVSGYDSVDKENIKPGLEQHNWRLRNQGRVSNSNSDKTNPLDDGRCKLREISSLSVQDRQKSTHARQQLYIEGPVIQSETSDGWEFRDKTRRGTSKGVVGEHQCESCAEQTLSEILPSDSVMLRIMKEEKEDDATVLFQDRLVETRITEAVFDGDNALNSCVAPSKSEMSVIEETARAIHENDGVPTQSLPKSSSILTKFKEKHARGHEINFRANSHDYGVLCGANEFILPDVKKNGFSNEVLLNEGTGYVPSIEEYTLHQGGEFDGVPDCFRDRCLRSDQNQYFSLGETDMVDGHKKASIDLSDDHFSDDYIIQKERKFSVQLQEPEIERREEEEAATKGAEGDILNDEKEIPHFEAENVIKSNENETESQNTVILGEFSTVESSEFSSKSFLSVNDLDHVDLRSFLPSPDKVCPVTTPPAVSLISPLPDDASIEVSVDSGRGPREPAKEELALSRSNLELEKLSHPLPNEEYSFEPEQTLFIFDWDDTLMPSSWLSQSQITLDESIVVPPEARPLLDAIGQSSQRLLESAAKMGTVVIVTNAEIGWIELSCAKFMPNLADPLKAFRTVSARSTYESAFCFGPFSWKQAAFRHEIERHFLTRPKCPKNILSLGDSAHERMALLCVCQELVRDDHGVTSKSVKFIERPSILDLQKEHDLVYGCLSRLGQHKSDLDLCIRTLDLVEEAKFEPIWPPADQAMMQDPTVQLTQSSAQNQLSPAQPSHQSAQELSQQERDQAPHESLEQESQNSAQQLVQPSPHSPSRSSTQQMTLPPKYQLVRSSSKNLVQDSAQELAQHFPQELGEHVQPPKLQEQTPHQKSHQIYHGSGQEHSQFREDAHARFSQCQEPRQVQQSSLFVNIVTNQFQASPPITNTCSITSKSMKKSIGGRLSEIEASAGGFLHESLTSSCKKIVDTAVCLAYKKAPSKSEILFAKTFDGEYGVERTVKDTDAAVQRRRIRKSKIQGIAGRMVNNGDSDGLSHQQQPRQLHHQQLQKVSQSIAQYAMQQRIQKHDHNKSKENGTVPLHNQQQRCHHPDSGLKASTQRPRSFRVSLGSSKKRGTEENCSQTLSHEHSHTIRQQLRQEKQKHFDHQKQSQQEVYQQNCSVQAQHGYLFRPVEGNDADAFLSSARENGINLKKSKSLTPSHFPTSKESIVFGNSNGLRWHLSVADERNSSIHREDGLDNSIAEKRAPEKCDMREGTLHVQLDSGLEAQKIGSRHSEYGENIKRLTSQDDTCNYAVSKKTGDHGRAEINDSDEKAVTAASIDRQSALQTVKINIHSEQDEHAAYETSDFPNKTQEDQNGFVTLDTTIFHSSSTPSAFLNDMDKFANPQDQISSSPLPRGAKSEAFSQANDMFQEVDPSSSCKVLGTHFSGRSELDKPSQQKETTHQQVAKVTFSKSNVDFSTLRNHGPIEPEDDRNTSEMESQTFASSKGVPKSPVCQITATLPSLFSTLPPHASPVGPHALFSSTTETTWIDGDENVPATSLDNQNYRGHLTKGIPATGSDRPRKVGGGRVLLDLIVRGSGSGSTRKSMDLS